MPCNDGQCTEPETTPKHLLCEAMTIIDNCNLKGECSAELLVWWRDHQAEEDSRVRREAAAKLTVRERFAIGIDAEGRSLPVPIKERLL